MKYYLLLASVLSLITACNTGPDLRYLESRSTASLEVPPDLTQVAVNEKFEIPGSISSGLGETVNKIPVLANVESIELQGSADFYWLNVEGTIENLYQTVKSFWGSQGYTLSTDEPIIGIMQTDWIYKEEGASKDQGFFAGLFGGKDLSASQDQFRTRIARDSNTSATQIYISHRGTSYDHRLRTKQTEDESPNKWAFRPPEPELEIEMLSRLMVYLGVARVEVDQQVSQVNLFKPRASIHTDTSENETFLLMRSARQQAWNRLLHELNRLDVEILSTDKSSGLGGDGVVFTKVLEKEMALIVTDESHELTRISLETADGDAETSPEGLEFLTLLYDHIK